MASLEDLSLSSDDASFQCNEREGFLKHVQEYDNFRSFINEEKLKAEVTKDGIHGLNRYITGQYKDWTDGELVIGITGNTGSGKSSLINALRGLKAKDKGAAAVGVTETTANIETYNYPSGKNIVLKDFPGVGTQNFPKDEYLHKTKILDSSVVIIVTSSRFTETDIWLAQEVRNVRKNVLFVRSKIDIDIYNMESDDPDNFSEYTCMEEIKTEIKEKMEQDDIPRTLFVDAIFLVSSRHRKKYDFNSLERKLMSLLSKKVEAICHHLFTLMKEAIAEKSEKTKTDFLGRKIASVVTGFLPLPKLESTADEYQVKKIIEECQEKFCVDQDSIVRLAKEIDMPAREIEIRLKSNDKRVADEHHLYTETEDKKWIFVQKYSKYTFPGLGMLFSAYKSPRTMQECLDKVCDVMAEDELMLVRLRLKKLEKDMKA